MTNNVLRLFIYVNQNNSVNQMEQTCYVWLINSVHKCLTWFNVGSADCSTLCPNVVTSNDTTTIHTYILLVTITTQLHT